jgi:thymidylate kinase
MTTIALIGPDGAGKTTICKRLESMEPERFRYLYMGVGRDSTNVSLPTTRLAAALKGRRRGYATGAAHASDAPAQRSEAHAIARRLRSAGRLLNQVAEEWYRQLWSWVYQRRGFVVLYDRHFLFDYTGADVAARNRTLGRRVHVWLLRHAYPRPDFTIFLDVPGEELYKRKGESDPESLERRRLAHVEQTLTARDIVRLDATGSVDAVAHAVRTLIGQLPRLGPAGPRAERKEDGACFGC